MAITVCTAINLGMHLLLCCIMLGMYRKHHNLGWQEIRFGVRRIRMHRNRRLVHIMDIYYRGSTYLMVISREDYQELSQNQQGSLMVYTREFRKRYLNPDFEKYEFSLREVDWNDRDKRKCLKSVIFSFIILECWICMLVFQL